ncbi:MAG: OB-fold nucleic acid binding domain-containing protein, partial [Akkermansia sp.]
LGIEVLGRCVNHSDVKFRPETMPNGKLALRFGLASVKSMSAETVRVIVEEREKNGPFKSLEDFCYRIPPQSVRRNQLEVLVQCGAFDWMHVCRAQIFASIEQCLGGAAGVHKDAEAGQMALFNMMDAAAATPAEHVVRQEWPKNKRLEDEKFLTGAYFTGHPLYSMLGVIDHERYVRIGTLPDLTPEEIRSPRDMAGMVRSVVTKMAKSSGRKFAVITVEDFTGTTEALVWGDSYDKAAQVEGLLQEGSFVRFRARISEDEKTGGKKVSANALELISSGNKRKGKQRFYEVVLNTSRHDAGDLQLIRDTLLKHPGQTPVRLTFRNSLGNSATLELGSKYCVNPDPDLDEALSLYS